MQYKYATEQLDYSDFASGRVFYSLPGHPAFPIRLASEIFQRCVAKREVIYGVSTSASLYDPCCGAAYHLSILAYLHRECIREVIGSDIDLQAVELARRNLGLLRMEGLEKRVSEISELYAQYRKASHKESLGSAFVLKQKLSTFAEKYPLTTKVFQSSATDSTKILNTIKAKSVDIVFTDVPYGQHSFWQAAHDHDLSNPLGAMLDSLFEVLSPSSILAIVSDKQQKVLHERYQRLEHFQVGKRRVVILKPI